MQARSYSSSRVSATFEGAAPSYASGMRGRLVLLIAVGALTVAPSALPATPTGLHGTVLSQTRPICYEGRSCRAPVPGVVLVFRRDGVIVARTTSQAGGTYRVVLRRGVYIVSAANVPTARIAPSSVRVGRGLMKRVDFDLDRGLQ